MWFRLSLFIAFHVVAINSAVIHIKVNWDWMHQNLTFCFGDQIDLYSDRQTYWQKFSEDRVEEQSYSLDTRQNNGKYIKLTASSTTLTSKIILFEINVVECFSKSLASTIATYGESISVNFESCDSLKKNGVAITIVETFDRNLHCVDGYLRLINLSNSHIGEYSINKEAFSLQRLLTKIKVTSHLDPIYMILNLDSLYFAIPEENGEAEWIVTQDKVEYFYYEWMKREDGTYLLEFDNNIEKLTVSRVTGNERTDFDIFPKVLSPIIRQEHDVDFINKKITCKLNLFEGLEIIKILLLRNGQHFFTYKDDTYQVVVPIDDCTNLCRYTCKINFKYRGVIGQTESWKNLAIHVLRTTNAPKLLLLDEGTNLILSPSQVDQTSHFCLSYVYNSEDKLLNNGEIIFLGSNGDFGEIIQITGVDCYFPGYKTVTSIVVFPKIRVENMNENDVFLQVEPLRIDDLVISTSQHVRNFEVELAFDESNNWGGKIYQHYSMTYPPKLGIRKFRVRMTSKVNKEIFFENYKFINIYPYTKLQWTSGTYSAYPGETLLICSSFSQPFMLWSVRIDLIEYNLGETPSFIKWINIFECAFIEVQDKHKKYTFLQNIRNKLNDDKDSFVINIKELPFKTYFNNKIDARAVECSLEMNTGYDGSIIDLINVYPLNDVTVNSVQEEITKAVYQVDSAISLDSVVSVCQVKFTPTAGSSYIVHIRSDNKFTVPVPIANLNIVTNGVCENDTIILDCKISADQYVGEGTLILYSKKTEMSEVVHLKKTKYNLEIKSINLEFPRSLNNAYDKYYCLVETNQNRSLIVGGVIAPADMARIAIGIIGVILRDQPLKISCFLNTLSLQNSRWGFSAPRPTSVTQTFQSRNFTLNIARFESEDEGIYQCIYVDSVCKTLKSDKIYVYAVNVIKKYYEINSESTIVYFPKNYRQNLKNVITNFWTDSIKLQWRIKGSTTALASVNCPGYKYQVKPENCSVEFYLGYHMFSSSVLFSNVWIHNNQVNHILDVNVVEFSIPSISGFEKNTYLKGQKDIKCVIDGPVHLISWLGMKSSPEATLIASRTIKSAYLENEKNELHLTISENESRNGDYYFCVGSTYYGMFQELRLMIPSKGTKIIINNFQLSVRAVYSSIAGVVVISFGVYFIFKK